MNETLRNILAAARNDASAAAFAASDDANKALASAYAAARAARALESYNPAFADDLAASFAIVAAIKTARAARVQASYDRAYAAASFDPT